MRKYYHSGQFRERFANLRAAYEGVFRQQIQRIRDLSSNNPTGQIPPLVDECLEYHARTYIINGLFEALNWPLQCDDGLPTLIPESPIESFERGTMRFLDYFGLSSTTRKPLIIIEAKRPNLRLPSGDLLPEVIAHGLDGENLGKEWNEILLTLKDYVYSTFIHNNYAPHRVIITNGSWLILFVDPTHTFVKRDYDEKDIIVYSNPDEIFGKANEIWNYLEYTNVAGGTETRSCHVGELPFLIEPSKIKNITYGVKLIYFKAPTHDKPIPQINVLPIVLIASQDDVWIYVQGNNHPGFYLPHKYTQLAVCRGSE